VQLHLGVTDNINTEVVSGDIKEGEQLVIGEAIPGSSDSGDARNPFAPQFRRRGSGGSRGH
jgi:hypothetical protein